MVTGGLCPVDWHYYNGSCFYASTIEDQQPDARVNCQAMDADLASISDENEMKFVEGIS